MNGGRNSLANTRNTWRRLGESDEGSRHADAWFGARPNEEERGKILGLPSLGLGKMERWGGKGAERSSHLYQAGIMASKKIQRRRRSEEPRSGDAEMLATYAGQLRLLVVIYKIHPPGFGDGTRAAASHTYARERSSSY